MGETMLSSDCPVELETPKEPLSATEHVMRYLARSDGFEDAPLPPGDDEQTMTPLFGVEVRPHRYLISVRLPEFRHDEVAVAITGSEVLIYGKHVCVAADSPSGRGTVRTFSKTFRLPHWIDLDSAEAVFAEEVLEVGFSRTVQAGLRFVHVKRDAELARASCGDCDVSHPR